MNRISKWAIACAIGCSVFGLAENHADAFNTGQHFLITSRALKRAGFGANSIAWVETASYAVDEASNYPDIAMFAGSDAQRTKNIGHYLHFDALSSPYAIQRELAWQKLAVETVVRAAAQRKDAATILSTIGIMSHAIQDFYSHSDFADFDWIALRGSRIVTTDDIQKDILDNSQLISRVMNPADPYHGFFSGKPSQPPYAIDDPAFPGHGGADDCVEAKHECLPVGGVNHDTVTRRHSLDAILMAQEATSELVERVKALVNDNTVWQTVRDNQTLQIGVEALHTHAMVMSRVSGQWGFPHDYTKPQIALASYDTQCPIVDCSDWSKQFMKTAAELFSAAPPGHATGGGAPPYPSNGTPLFEIPTPTFDLSSYTGQYTLQWGDKTGTMELQKVYGPTSPLSGKIVIAGKTYQVAAFRALPNGFTIEVSTNKRWTMGNIFPIGTKPNVNRQFAGYLRDERGIPDGVVMTQQLNRMPSSPAVKQ